MCTHAQTFLNIYPDETMLEKRIPNTVQIPLRAAYFTVFVTATKLACVAVGAVKTITAASLHTVRANASPCIRR
jgi:hypothetical protein